MEMNGLESAERIVLARCGHRMERFGLWVGEEIVVDEQGLIKEYVICDICRPRSQQRR